MSNRNVLIIGWIVILLFVSGIIHLLMLRFSAGDVYPYYSSLRADPLGTKALYESLEICCDFPVERNHEPFSRIKDKFDSTVLVLGMDHRSLASVPKTIGEEVNYFVNNGGRLVITLQRSKAPKGFVSLDPGESGAFLDLTEVWGIRLFLETRVTGGAYLASEYRVSNLPKSISVHNPLYFQTVHPGWKTIYQRAQHPVVIERKLGRGSLVISSESYLLSNEALTKERHPALLVWLVGNPKSVVFDEFHHGVAADAGVMYLARKYDLEWLFFGLLFLALFFIWKNVTPFVPPEKEPAESLQSGKESVAGLTNLIRRNVPASQLLSVSYAEWQKTAKGKTEQRKQEMQRIITGEMAKPAGRRNLPAAYNALSRALKQRR